MYLFFSNGFEAALAGNFPNKQVLEQLIVAEFKAHFLEDGQDLAEKKIKEISNQIDLLVSRAKGYAQRFVTLVKEFFQQENRLKIERKNKSVTA